MPAVNELKQGLDNQSLPPAVIVTTLLMHESGQWIESELTMWPKDGTPQAIGSCISYARRYALAAIVGVYQADDDAEGAHGRTAAAQEPGELEAQLGAVVNAIKAEDAGSARRVWTELNALGTTAEIWRVLNTKQKKAMRDLLQQTEAAVVADKGEGDGA